MSWTIGREAEIFPHPPEGGKLCFGEIAENGSGFR